MTAMAIAISSATQAAYITGKVYCRDSIILDDSGGNVTASLVRANGVKSWVDQRGLDGCGSFADTAVLFTALWVFKPSTAAKPLGKVSSLRFTPTPSFVAIKKDGLHIIGGTGILPPGLDRTPAIRIFPARGTASDHQTDHGSSPSVANPALVPDGGRTFALLGTCLLGLQVLRRKL